MEKYDKILDRIKKNKKIKAVVLRINSPGGSSFTSDLFWKKIEEIKKTGKYVVASYGTYAASGGYYISCGADKIISEPTCLTGSIGVFSMIPDMSQFFRNKIGINWDTIGTGHHTFIYSPLVVRNQADHEKIIRNTEKIYALFKKRVADARGLTLENVENIAQGRVWTGNQAVLVGLVDTIGNLDDAIKIAAHGAGIDTYKILEYPIIKKTFYEELMSGLLATADMAIGRKMNYSSHLTKEIQKMVEFVENASVSPQARLPYMISKY